YLNSLLGVTTPLSTSDIRIIGNEFNVSIPVSLMLSSATKPPEEWTYNLWPRNGVGLNVQVSDLAPDDGNSAVHAVPEPTAICLLVFGILGLAALAPSRGRRIARAVSSNSCVAAASAALLLNAPGVARADWLIKSYASP